MVQILKNTTTRTLLEDALTRKADFNVGVAATKKVVPNLNISFDCAAGSEQFFLNLNRRSARVTTEPHTYLANELRLTVGNETDIWHMDAVGDFKWDIEYATDPRISKGIPLVEHWDLTCSPGIRFLYQDTLENDWAKSSMGMTLSEYLVANIRPAKVVGSYAVYSDKKDHAVRPDGSTIVNYATGKLAHIYRPLCVDAAGNQVWGVLNITGGTLSIEIPASYLDNAVYPVTLDPTIGYQTAGGSYNTVTNGIRACRFNAPSSGDANPGQLYVYASANVNPRSLVGAVYADNAGTAASRNKLSADSNVMSFWDGVHWQNDAITWTGIVAGVDYWIAVNCEDHAMKYDTGTAGLNDMEHYTRIYDGTMDATFSATPSTLAWEFSMYITYTAGGGGLSIPAAMHHYNNMRL